MCVCDGKGEERGGEKGAVGIREEERGTKEREKRGAERTREHEGGEERRRGEKRGEEQKTAEEE